MYPLSSQAAHDKDLLEDDKIQLLSNFLRNNAYLLGLTFYYHWNANASPLLPFRELSAKHCEELYSFLGILAARMRSLGYRVSAPFVDSEFVDEGLNDISYLATELSHHHARLGRVAEELAQLCEELQDDVTAELLQKRRFFHRQAASQLANLTH